MLKKGSPRSIMLNEGKGPYDHLAFPVGGLSSNRSTSGRSQADNMKRKAKLSNRAKQGVYNAGKSGINIILDRVTTIECNGLAFSNTLD
jgi:hypothetical protein